MLGKMTEWMDGDCDDDERSEKIMEKDLKAHKKLSNKEKVKMKLLEQAFKRSYRAGMRGGEVSGNNEVVMSGKIGKKKVGKMIGEVDGIGGGEKSGKVGNEKGGSEVGGEVGGDVDNNGNAKVSENNIHSFLCYEIFDDGNGRSGNEGHNNKNNNNNKNHKKNHHHNKKIKNNRKKKHIMKNHQKNKNTVNKNTSKKIEKIKHRLKKSSKRKINKRERTKKDQLMHFGGLNYSHRRENVKKKFKSLIKRNFLKRHIGKHNNTKSNSMNDEPKAKLMTKTNMGVNKTVFNDKKNDVFIGNFMKNTLRIFIDTTKKNLAKSSFKSILDDVGKRKLIMREFFIISIYQKEAVKNGEKSVFKLEITTRNFSLNTTNHLNNGGYFEGENRGQIDTVISLNCFGAEAENFIKKFNHLKSIQKTSFSKKLVEDSDNKNDVKKQIPTNPFNPPYPLRILTNQSYNASTNASRCNSTVSNTEYYKQHSYADRLLHIAHVLHYVGIAILGVFVFQVSFSKLSFKSLIFGFFTNAFD